MDVIKTLSIDIIKYPLLTEKTVKLLEQRQYCFIVSATATKPNVKEAIEKLFNVKVISVNTTLRPLKKRRVGKYIGQKSQYKKAIVTLATDNFIKIFED
jgi:large subunit ribosomal protein L23